jgi:hypothetical protein
VEPTEVVAVLAALFAGYLTGRRGTIGFHVVTGPARTAGHLAGAAAGQLASVTTGVARRVMSGAGEVSAVGLDAARGAAAGAGFGFIQFRAARHVRAHPSRPPTKAGGPVGTDPNIAGPPDVPTSSRSGGAPMVLVTGGTRFHRQGCSAVRGDAHEVGRDEALAEGRVPCRSCNP